MSDKPREWWIPDIEEVKVKEGFEGAEDVTHVIEYSAYETAIREREVRALRNIIDSYPDPTAKSE